jgi:16S rRNA processing protein RimM
VSAKTGKLVTVGRVSGVHGVKGWLKIRSFTEPPANITSFEEWLLRRGGAIERLEVEATSVAAGRVAAKLRGIDDRDAARTWIGAEIAVERSRLPPPGPDEYYWTDLEGLEVRTVEGERLGAVDHLIATGANDVLVLDEGGRLIPFVLGSVVRSVDVGAGVIVVDWSAEY